MRITFPDEVLKEVPLRPGLSVVATVHTRDPDAPKPTLLGALGLEALGDKSDEAVSDAVAAIRPGGSTPATDRRRARLCGRAAKFLAQATRGVHLHGVRDVHGDPGHPDRFGLAVADPGGLSASSDEITWVQTSYLIAEVIMIPLSGFLSRVVSTRVIFTISAGGFTLMSFMCAHANSH